MHPAHKDRVEALYDVARWYVRNGFRACVNDGLSAAHELEVEGRRLRPSLSIWEGPTLVRFVEVETAASLDDFAPLRWERSLGSSIPLHVYVPFNSMGRAWDLRDRSAAALGARILTYDVRRVSDTVAAWTPLERIHERA